MTACSKKTVSNMQEVAARDGKILLLSDAQGAQEAHVDSLFFFIEVIATFFFLYVIIGTTSKGAAVGFAGI
jgi:hypothetical protein